jgi:superoxide dismutase, Cu-Zn family
MNLFQRISPLGYATALAALAACAPFNNGPRTATAIISDANGQTIGAAKFTETATGTRISLRVKGLTMGRHGTHLHANASCDDTKDAKGNAVKFGGAGAHFDPVGTMMHGSPYGTDHTNHAGDLENTVVDEDGDGYVDMTDRHVTITPGNSSIIGRSIIIHANEDAFTNEPANGGSGARIACGVIALSN